MSGVRLIPIVGLLAMMALAPGALACHGCGCGGGSQTNNNNGGFSALSAPTAPPPAAVGALVALSVAFVGGILAVLLSLGSRTAGRWVSTPEGWVWQARQK